MLEEVSHSYARANWRSGNPSRFESLWCVLHKFCELNAVFGPDIEHRFSALGLRGAMICRREAGRRFAVHDLRFEGKIDAASLSRTMGVDERWRCEASFQAMGRRSIIRRWAMPFLRFCPVCIETGYHAMIFQIGTERACPVHHRPLEDNCPKCGRRIPYSLPSRKVRPFSCECGRLLWWGLRDDAWPTDPLGENAPLLVKHAAKLIEDRRLGAIRTADAQAIVWLCDRGQSEESFRRARRRNAGVTVERVEVAVVSRSWGNGAFKTWPRSRYERARFMRSFQRVIPLSKRRSLMFSCGSSGEYFGPSRFPIADAGSKRRSKAMK